ncbi:MAG: T9SS type A sorting domain-containing protein [candidate division WOR-3 bacterium]
MFIHRYFCYLLPALLLGQVAEWVYRYDGPAHGIDAGYSITYGADGCLYVAGTSYSNETGADIVVIKLTADGNPCWVYRSGNSLYGYEKANQIVYGADNNLYVAGTSGLSYGNNQDFVVVSIDTAGNERWVWRHDGQGPGTDYEEANSLIYYTDGFFGYIYAAGTTAFYNQRRNFTVVDLIDWGWLMNSYQYNGSGNDDDVAESIVFGPDTNLYVAGYSVGSQYEDFTIISLSRSCSQRWVWKTGIYLTNLLNQIVCGNNGVFACGVTYNPPYDLPMFVVVSVSYTGSTRWIYLYPNPSGNCGDYANSLVISNDSISVFVAGGTGDETYDQDLTVISLATTTGEQNWIYKYTEGNYSILESANEIVITPHNFLYTVGTSYGNGIIVISLDTQGHERWVYQYTSPGGSNIWDSGNSIVYGDNKIYIAGASGGVGTESDLVVICLRDTLLINVDEENQNLAFDGQKQNLSVYPNPFKDYCVIKFQIQNYGATCSQKSVAGITIYDATGRLIKTFSALHYNLSNSVHSVVWDGTDDFGRRLPAGVYFVRLDIGDFRKVEKVVLLN